MGFDLFWAEELGKCLETGGKVLSTRGCCLFGMGGLFGMVVTQRVGSGRVGSGENISLSLSRNTVTERKFYYFRVEMILIENI